MAGGGGPSEGITAGRPPPPRSESGAAAMTTSDSAGSFDLGIMLSEKTLTGSCGTALASPVAEDFERGRVRFGVPMSSSRDRGALVRGDSSRPSCSIDPILPVDALAIFVRPIASPSFFLPRFDVLIPSALASSMSAAVLERARGVRLDLGDAETTASSSSRICDILGLQYADGSSVRDIPIQTTSYYTFLQTTVDKNRLVKVNRRWFCFKKQKRHLSVYRA